MKKTFPESTSETGQIPKHNQDIDLSSSAFILLILCDKFL